MGRHTLTLNQRIEKFNAERGLLNKGFEWSLEYNMIHEEMKEFKIANARGDINEQIDALCDIIVVATGSILKLGYDPYRAMDETLNEIEDRTGAINPVTGKWQKKLRGNEYKADYTKARND